MITYKGTVAGLTTYFSVAAREAISQWNKIFKNCRENNCHNEILKIIQKKHTLAREKTEYYQALIKVPLKDISQL